MIKGKVINKVRDLALLKFFNVSPKFKQGVSVTEVRCPMPPPSWTKLTIDGCARGQPRIFACRDVFRMNRGFIKGSFAMPLGVHTTLFAQIMGLIHRMELACVKK